jgi:acyl carrier protein
METKIKTIIAEQFGKDIKDITNNLCIINDLGADSLDIVEIIMSTESAFGIAIESEEFTSSTVQFLLDLTAKKCSKNPVDH